MWFGEQQAKLVNLTGQEGQLPLVKATFSERLACIGNIFQQIVKYADSGSKLVELRNFFRVTTVAATIDVYVLR